MTTPTEAKELGVQFPLRDGRRSTQSTGRAVFADAARYTDADLTEKIEASKDWRKTYIDRVTDLVRRGAQNPKDALRIAADGLDSLHKSFVFERDDSTVPLADALSGPTGAAFETEVIQGRGEARGLEIPLGKKRLEGDELLRQLDRWEAAGTIEPSCAEAIRTVAQNPDWLDLSDQRFALLGAASEMGPLASLTGWGADVIALDLPAPRVWERIVETALRGRGRVFAPIRPEADKHLDVIEKAGADLITETPQIRDWLATFDDYTLGNYVYADGGTFVRLAAAVDALVADLLDRKKATSIAYLATPTDVFAVPMDVVEGAKRRRQKSRLRPLIGVTSVLSLRKLCDVNYRDLTTSEDGKAWGIVDCLVPQQGPNYALAKTLQRWRASLLREGGTRVSANVAPATRTRSVVKNRILAAAYRGAPTFGVDIFEPATSSALMATLLVHDLRRDGAAGDPNRELAHPYDLFVEGAAHGGLWRLSYEPRSILPLAVVLGLTKQH